MRRLLLMLLILLPSFIYAQDNPQLDIEKDYLYADIVVKGVVEDIKIESVHSQDYSPGVFFEKMLKVANIKFRILDVLIGEWEGEYLPLVGLVGWSVYSMDLEIGDTYILSARYSDKGPYFEGGKFILRNDSSRFLITDSHWTRGAKKYPSGTGSLDQLTQGIKSIAIKRDFKYLTRESDTILSGLVKSVKTEISEKSGKVRVIRVDILELLSGSIENHVHYIDINLLATGKHEYSWKNNFPKITEGEMWLFFLKYNEEVGYYVFAGLNGCFQIEGNALIRRHHNKMYINNRYNEIRESIQAGKF